MTILDYILDGFEDALQLERELGVRLFECERALLEPLKSAPPPPQPRSSGNEAQAQAPSPPAPPARPTEVAPVVKKEKAPSRIVFLHDRPLSAAGAEMISKIVDALGKSYPDSVGADIPVLCDGQLPQASAYVVLGAGALRKYFPGSSASPGMWIKSLSGSDVLVTYSPEYILRFGSVTPAVQKIKKDMWTSLKALAQRAAQYN